MSSAMPSRSTPPAKPDLRRRAARRALHRRRRPREREHRPHRRPLHLPRRAQPSGRSDQDGAHRRCRRNRRRDLPEPVAAHPRQPARSDAEPSSTLWMWDGERLFQAARFGTEMQYQHLVFEEFARTIMPQVDEFLAPNGYDTTIDPSIFAEFAHTVFRFGHSMLTETVDRFDPNFNLVNRSEQSRPSARPDRGLPQPAAVCGQRPHSGGSDRRHRARLDPPGRQRDRRVRHRSGAQQPARHCRSTSLCSISRAAATPAFRR